MTQKKYNTKCINTIYWYIKSMKSLTHENHMAQKGKLCTEKLTHIIFWEPTLYSSPLQRN